MTASTTGLTVIAPAGTAADATMPDPGERRRRFRFIQNPKAATGTVILGIYVIFAIIGPWIAPYDPSQRGNSLVAAPSAKHWFGTTHLGQDIFSQVLVGTRGVLYVGFLAGAIATVLSVLVGVTAGYLGGLTDEGMSALSNVFLVIPALPLIVIITSALPGANDTLIALLIGLTSWAWGARILRAQTLSLRRRDYVEAARASGEKTWRVILFEIMPNLTAVIASGFVGTVIFAVMSEITLAFIGVSDVSEWNWGTILYWAQSQQALDQHAWWWFVPAGLAVALLGTSLALLNFGIDEFVNPRLRDSGGQKIRTVSGAVRMRVGFTPVVRPADLRPPRGAPVPTQPTDAVNSVSAQPTDVGVNTVSFGKERA